MEATKRPWKVQFESYVMAEDGGQIASVTDGRPEEDTNNEIMRANAALIVQAVNAHDALVEALREISKGEGRFSLDHHTHANNTIEDMKELAVNALRLVGAL